MYVLSIALISLLLSPAFGLAATTYFVGTNGSDSNTPAQAQNSNTPWLTLQKCANTAVNGDTCSVNDGTYTVSSTSQSVLISTAGVTYKSTNKLGAKISGNSNHTAVGFNVTTNNITIQDFEIYGFSSTGINANGTVASANLTIRGNTMHDIARICTNGNGFAGVYVKAGTSNLLIERNIFYTMGRFANGENGCSTTSNMQNDHGIYIAGSTGTIIRRNIFYDITRGFNIHMYPNQSSSLTITQNVFSDASPYTQGLIIFATSIVTADVSNNIFYAPSVGAINSQAAATYSGVTVRNNLVSNNVSMWERQGSPISPPSGTTGACGDHANVCNTNPLFANAASRNYTLLSGSPAIDTGVDVGLSFNGSAPDKGVFEVWTNASCSVADATPGVINLVFNNNAFPPIGQASPTTFTAKKGVNDNPVTGTTRIGDNQVNVAVQNTYGAGDVVKYTWTPGTMSDSALVGGTLSQPYLDTTEKTCVNNVSSGPSWSLNQTAFQWFGLRGTESTLPKKPSSAATENTNIGIIVGGSGWIRFNVTCTSADCPSSGMFLRYSKNGGSYAVVPDAFGADNLAFCGSSPLDSVPSGTTSEQLASGGLTFDAGLLVRSSNAIPTVTLSQNHKTELAYCLQLDTDTPVGTTYDFRLYQQDGTQISNYTVTPRLTVIDVAAGGGF